MCSKSFLGGKDPEEGVHASYSVIDLVPPTIGSVHFFYCRVCFYKSVVVFFMGYVTLKCYKIIVGSTVSR